MVVMSVSVHVTVFMGGSKESGGFALLHWAALLRQDFLGCIIAVDLLL